MTPLINQVPVVNLIYSSVMLTLNSWHNQSFAYKRDLKKRHFQAKRSIMNNLANERRVLKHFSLVQGDLQFFFFFAIQLSILQDWQRHFSFLNQSHYI